MTHTANKIQTIAIKHRSDADKRILLWREKIVDYIKLHFPYVEYVDSLKADAIIILGGDGSILEIAKQCISHNPFIFGLNLGHVGFLASVRDENDFEKGIHRLLSGNFSASNRSLINVSLVRGGNVLCVTECLNDVFIKSLAGMCELSLSIDDTAVQRIRGTGVLVSTPTGSTAFNLSAHGPIVMPTLRCMIITELLDHDIPTPSVIVDNHQEIKIKIISFRKSGDFVLKKGGNDVDVVLSADSTDVYPMEVGDEIIIRTSQKTVSIVELESGYFLKSIQEKFSFK